jgi:D-serine deaminase-like pyridoxal phosphate-dependent protein
MSPIWPQRLNLPARSFTTPLPAVRLDHLRGAAAAIASSHETAHVVWRPTLPASIFADLTRALKDCGATAFSCSRLATAEALAALGESSVTLLRPPVIGSGPRRLAELATRIQVTVACDHFAQVEQLADACRDAGASCSVLANIDVGRRRLGIRPGPDLSDFLESAASLAGVCLTGLSVENCTHSGAGVARLAAAELKQVLLACRRSLDRAGCAAAMLSLSTIGELEDLPFERVEARTPIATVADGTAALIAGVIGRPTRDLAVIDAGVNELHDGGALLAPPAGMHLFEVRAETAVLKVDGAQQDLMIGDLVAFETSLASALHGSRSVLLGEAGSWRVVDAMSSL